MSFGHGLEKHFCNNTAEAYFLELNKKLKEFSVKYSGYL